MTLVPASAIQPIEDWMPDISGLNSSASNDIKNLINLGDRYVPAKSTTPLANPLSETVLGAISAQDTTGTTYTFCGSSTALYLQSGLTFNDVSRVSGGAYTTADSGRWRFAVYGDRIIGANAADNLQSFVVSADTKFSELVAIKAKDLAVVANFVVLINTFDGVDGQRIQRVRWSAIDDPTDYTISAQTQSDIQELAGPGGENVAIVPNQNYAIILQERSIWRMDYQGSPTVFSFSEVEQNRGTTIQGSVVSDGPLVFYIGDKGFYMFDGTKSNAIGYRRVDKWFADNLNTEYAYRISSSIDTVNRLVKWSFPSKSSLDGTPDTIIYYNYLTDKWSYSVQSVEFMFRALSAPMTLEQLDTLYPGGLETIPVSLDNVIFAGGKMIDGCFDGNHTFSSFDGDNLTGYIEFGDNQLFDGQRTYLSEIIPVSDGDVTINIKYRDKLSAEYAETGQTATSDVTGAAYFNLDARFLNPCVTVSGSAFTYISGLRYRAKPAGVA